MIVLTGGFHWSSLSTYLPTIYLPIIYLSNLSIYLPLTSFVSLEKKPMNTDASHQRNPTDTPQPCMQMLSNPAVLKRDGRGVRSSASLKVWQNLNTRRRENYRSRVHLYWPHCVSSHPSPCLVSPGSHTGLSGDSSLRG